MLAKSVTLLVNLTKNQLQRLSILHIVLLINKYILRLNNKQTHTNKGDESMEVKAKNNTMKYNGACYICGKIQDGGKPQPHLVWYRYDGQKRGTNKPICSYLCLYKALAKFNDCWF